MATDLSKKLFSEGYHCVLVGDVWHLIQGQFSPPPLLDGGAWTLCTLWATFKRGLIKRRPDCPKCVEYVLEWEAKHGTTQPIAAPVEVVTQAKIAPNAFADMLAEDEVTRQRYEKSFEDSLDGRFPQLPYGDSTEMDAEETPDESSGVLSLLNLTE